jgi:RNA polymerase sigma-70 factor (ECF subfamily)
VTAPDRADGDLVRAARAGDEAAAGALFRRHWPATWRIAAAVARDTALADEAAQDGWERAFRTLDRFDDRRPFFPWVARIVARRALTAAERESRHRRPAVTVEPTACEDSADDALEPVRAAVAALPAERRAIVTLHYSLGYSIDEAAAILGIAQGTAASRLSRALADLRQSLREGVAP